MPQIRRDDYVRIKDLRNVENIKPFITEEMMALSGKVFKVTSVGSSPLIENRQYATLEEKDDNRFYWLLDWLEALPRSFRYENLMRLDM